MAKITKPKDRPSTLPLPEPDDQHNLIADLTAARQTATTKRTEAQTLRASALAVFESALFTASDSAEISAEAESVS